MFHDEVFAKSERPEEVSDSDGDFDEFSDNTYYKHEMDRGTTRYINGSIVPSSFGIGTIELLRCPEESKERIAEKIKKDAEPYLKPVEMEPPKALTEEEELFGKSEEYFEN